MAISSAVLIMFLPIHVEMLGWGGYPNLLSLSILMVSIGLLTSWLKSGGRRAFLALLSMSAIIAVGHNLTLLVYFTTLLLLLVSTLVIRSFRSSLKILTILLFIVGIYLIYILVFLWPSQYILNNEAAYYRLKVVLSTGFLTWIFKSGGFLLLLYSLMAVSILSALLTRQKLMEIGILASWLISPFLLLNLHEFGIALDYQRIFFFFVDPFVLLASSVTVFLFSKSPVNETYDLLKLKEWISRIFGSNSLSFFKRLLQTLLLIGLIIACIASVSYGYWTLKSVDSWYNYRDKYGDWEKLDALKWIKNNVPERAVIVAEEEIGRWIEGYSSRRVLMYAHPMYLFIKGEQERAYAARAILLSSFCLTNDVAAMYEPHDPRENISTRIALKTLGALEEILYLEANSSYVEGYFGRGVFREYLSDARDVEILEGADSVRIRYIFDHIIVEKILSMERGFAEASLIFRIEALEPDVKPEKLVVELREWFTRRIWEVKVKPGGRLLLVTDVGQILLETNSITAFPFIFNANQSAEIKLSALEGVGGGGEVRLVHSTDLMKKFGARYIVIPRLQEAIFKRYIILKPITKPEYMHLLSDPSYRIVYQNEKVIILELVK